MSPIPGVVRTALDTVATYFWWAQTEFRGRFGRAASAFKTVNRHVLLLAWALPPTIGGGVYRPTSFLKYGPALGWRMSAISGAAPGKDRELGQYLLETIPDSVQIYRLDRPSLRPSWRFSPRIDGGFLNALATVELAIRIFKDDPPSVILASGPPFHNFAAAYFIARYFGAKLALDYRDEWSAGTREFIQLGNVDRWWERRCLRRADVVFFATQSIQNLYLDIFPQLRKDRCHILHNGWEPAEFEALRCREKARSFGAGKRIISYVGNAGVPLPGGFLETLREILARNRELAGTIRVRFVGVKSPEAMQQFAGFEGLFPGVLDLVEQLPKSKAIQVMAESHALLLLNPPHLERALTGKIFDYLASGRPLLVYGDTGEIGQLMRELSAGVMVSVGDSNGLERALLQLKKMSSLHWVTRPRIEFLKSHTREILAEKMFYLIGSL